MWRTSRQDSGGETSLRRGTKGLKPIILIVNPDGSNSSKDEDDNKDYFNSEKQFFFFVNIKMIVLNCMSYLFFKCTYMHV